MCIPLGGVSQAKPERKGARMGGYLQTPVTSTKDQGSQRAP